jgi:propanediol dehydratase large subunit
MALSLLMRMCPALLGQREAAFAFRGKRKTAVPRSLRPEEMAHNIAFEEACSMSPTGNRPNRWRRFADWDARPLRLDKFAREDPANGFAAMHSPKDPAPAVSIENGRVAMMDGVLEADFDMIDRFIAQYHIDPAIAPEAMAIAPLDLARMLVDPATPRTRLTRLAHGLTPARLAETVAHLSALEIAFAYSKMRARRVPGNQGHVTNAKDDPLQLAADAAIAVALGFDEIETTQRVARNAWSNALACAVGASIGRWGTLFQCSSEEAEELRIAMAGFTSYAETVSVYGSEGAFIDGDDTPWSKAFLAAAYASRGVKMRATSGAGAELLMGFHQSQSLLYLEARCLCLQRAMGVQGTQNGGIDGAPVTMSIQGGARELMAENLIAVWLDLECASGNDARPTESEIRVGAKIAPYLLAGSDLICSGFGSILKYDNSFNPSLLNGEELEDFLVLQRDFEADGGLTPIGEEQALDLRRHALDAISAVLDELGLANADAAMRESVALASGSNDTESFSPGDASAISAAIEARGITVIDVIRALHKRGFVKEAENLFQLVRLRLSGDYLQTSALVRGGKVISAVNDPNDYAGPGTGYRLDAERREAIGGLRDQIDQREVLRSQAMFEKAEARRVIYQSRGVAGEGKAGNDVVIGLSPAFGTRLFRSLAGEPVSVMLEAVIDGIASGGCIPRVIRMGHTADTSFLGLSAARLAGSGIGIGLQAKGTAVIHQRERLPHHNLELFSNAPITTLSHYRRLGENAAAYALGRSPEPVVVSTRGEALGARYHAEVAMIYAIETSICEDGAAPQELDVRFRKDAAA